MSGNSRESAYCLSCRRDRPVTYGYRNQPTAAVTMDIGGPVNLTRIVSTTKVETHCSVCGYRVFTAGEIARLNEKEASDRAIGLLIGIFAIIAIGIVIALEISVSQ